MAGKSKQINITASFGADLITGGAVVIPRLLLENYYTLGINNQELVFLLHLLRLAQTEGNLYPDIEQIAAPMSLPASEVRHLIASLMEKGALKIDIEYKHTQEIGQTYSLAPLFEKLSEIWACAKVKKLQKTKEMLGAKSTPQVAAFHDKPVSFGVTKLARSLAEEFGRPLSPIEIDQVKAWVDDDLHREEVIMEGLKRAVLLGKLNFRYIDSILFEWKKNGLKSVTAITNYEARFKEKHKGKATSSAKVKTTEAGKKENRRKELLKLLYMN